MVVASQQLDLDRDLQVGLRFRWTNSKFEAMSGLDEFQDQKFLLIDGELYEMPAPGPHHTRCTQKLTKLFLKSFESAFSVRSQLSMTIGELSNPLPDMCLAVGDDDIYSEVHPTPNDVPLLVEVSDTTLRFDLGPKMHLYASAGITDYWVIDLNDRLLHVHRDPVADEATPRGFRYGSVQVLTESDTIAPLAAPQTPLRITDMLP